MISFLFFVFLWCSCWGPPRAFAQDCWVGTNNNQSVSGYPPAETPCLNQPGFVCQLEQTRPQGYYNLLCVTDAVCQAVLGDYDANPSLSPYTRVICCSTNLCNSYPGQPGTLSSSAGQKKEPDWTLRLSFLLLSEIFYQLLCHVTVSVNRVK
jgi:hypothetical protein